MIIKNPTIIIKGGETLGGEDKEIIIKLPEQFAASTNIYHFKVDDDRYLLSALGWVSGLWEYTVSTGKANQIYAEGNGWLYFKEVPNGVLVSTHQSSNSGLLFYDKSTGVITRKTQSGYGYQYFYKVNNSEMLIKGAETSVFLVYNTTDDSVISTNHSSSNLTIVVDESDNTIWGLSATNLTSILGVWKFDPGTYKFIRLADKGYNFTRFVFKDVIIYSGVDYALLYHDKSTDIITVISQDVNMYIDAYSNITQAGNNFLIPPRRQNQPIRLIEGDTLMLKEVYPALNSSSTSIFSPYISPVSDSIVLISGSSNFGIVCYDNTTQTATQIYEGVSAVSFKHTINGKMIGATYNVSISSNKVLSYDIATNTVSEIYTVESTMYDSKQVGDNILFVASNSSSVWKGVLVYNGITESIEKLYTSGYGWRLYVIGNDCLISSSVSSYTGILVFDGDAMTITKKYSPGYYWEFKMDDDGRFIGTTKISSWDDWILEYSSENKTITLKEYIIR